MAEKTGFLILSHQLMSMVPPLAAALKRRGIRAYVLSSSPTREVEAAWQDEVELVRITDAPALRSADVDRFLAELSADGVRLLGCLTVWDAYRVLMAYANRRLGTPDLSEETVRGVRDKLAMRTFLRVQGLSEVAAWPLTEARFEALEDKSRYFVKPREGLASMGAFRADRLTDVAELDGLWQQACADRAYAGVFEGEPSFIVEEFIDGVECSFETSVTGDAVTVHAVHEKVDLRQAGRTTLENACVCPPRSLDPAEVRLGVEHVERCLRALGVDTGVHHVEARFQRGRGWEIVEVNPRIGGAYIVASTLRHRGVDVLELWIDQLLGRPVEPTASEERSTFFRVFYGEPGRRVARVARGAVPVDLVEDKLFVREGERLPEVDREIFVGQALWDVTSLSPDALDAFLRESESHLRIEYSA
ncbi:acetyl-CoA carboxylase biotin carboxylase subunit family protein [Kitasatospora sp. NPDC093550]|uniref:ATP-grasp domain-containing protein n=1 Tax=Kitasatospora sp. NPDC093550 TaxID=3364089 RepID=UPI00380721EB